MQSWFEFVLRTKRGQRSEVPPKDQFLMLVCVLKHDGRGQLYAHVLKHSPVMFDKLLTRVTEVAALILYNGFEADAENCVIMTFLKEERQQLPYHSHDLYATAVMF